MSEGEHKGSVQHTPAEWTSSNQDQYVTADKARYNSEKVSVSGQWEIVTSLICRHHAAEAA